MTPNGNKPAAWPAVLNTYSFFGKAQNKVVNQQNTCNLKNFVSEKSYLLSEKSYLFLPFYLLSFPFANYYERFNFFSYILRVTGCFPRSPLNFCAGNWCATTKKCAHLRMPGVWLYYKTGHPGNHKIPISPGGGYVTLICLYGLEISYFWWPQRKSSPTRQLALCTRGPEMPEDGSMRVQTRSGWS